MLVDPVDRRIGLVVWVGRVPFVGVEVDSLGL